MKSVWPNFFIVGTSRAGTTSLYNYLSAVPDVYLAPKGKIHFFFPEEFNKNQSKEEEYLSLFEQEKSKKALGEYAGYLNNSESARLIKSIIPESKILISLRDPVERAFSHYLVAMRGHDETKSFSDSFDKFMNPIDKNSNFFQRYIKPGLYYEDVKRFLDIFGKDKVKIIIFEEFIKNPKEEFGNILRFLEIKSEVPDIVGKAFNVYGEPLGKAGTKILKNKIISTTAKKIIPKETRVGLLRFITNKKSQKPELLQCQRAFLEKFYINDSLKLEKLLGRTLPWTLLEKHRKKE